MGASPLRGTNTPPQRAPIENERDAGSERQGPVFGRSVLMCTKTLPKMNKALEDFPLRP
jgi:hypothetical protein